MAARLALVLAVATAGVACDKSVRGGSKRTHGSGKVPESGHTARIGTTFDKAEMQGLGLSFEAMEYKFSYLEIKTDGPIDFGGGTTADVTIAPSLPVGRSGTIMLEVLEGGVVKLRGETKDVTLHAGTNEVDLNLEPVDGTPTPQSASLKLKLRIGDRAPLPGDLPQGWDGKSHRSNAVWQLDVVSRR